MDSLLSVCFVCVCVCFCACLQFFLHSRKMHWTWERLPPGSPQAPHHGLLLCDMDLPVDTWEGCGLQGHTCCNDHARSCSNIPNREEGSSLYVWYLINPTFAEEDIRWIRMVPWLLGELSSGGNQGFDLQLTTVMRRYGNLLGWAISCVWYMYQCVFRDHALHNDLIALLLLQTTYRQIYVSNVEFS